MRLTRHERVFVIMGTHLIICLPVTVTCEQMRHTHSHILVNIVNHTFTRECTIVLIHKHELKSVTNICI